MQPYDKIMAYFIHSNDKKMLIQREVLQNTNLKTIK